LGDGTGVSFNNNSTKLAVMHNGSGKLKIYNRSGDTYTAISDPATTPEGEGKCKFNNNNSLATANTNSPQITIYNISGDTFTKLSNPATLAPDDANDVAWSQT
jgi:hypothetical protein